jgi:hypothetical protein
MVKLRQCGDFLIDYFLYRSLKAEQLFHAHRFKKKEKKEKLRDTLLHTIYLN